ncbi:hypothetical protein [Persephonella sp.]
MSRAIRDIYIKFPVDQIASPKFSDDEWVVCMDIQRELSKKGYYVSLSKIGRYAGKHNLKKETNLGFNLYHRKLVDIILKDIQEAEQ